MGVGAGAVSPTWDAAITEGNIRCFYAKAVCRSGGRLDAHACRVRRHDDDEQRAGGAGTGGHTHPVAACATGSISTDGSSAIKTLIQKAADQYQAKCPGATITVAATNSSTGVTKAASGAVDIGDSDVPAGLVQGVDATTIVDHPVAIVLFAVVVNSAAPG